MNGVLKDKHFWSAVAGALLVWGAGIFWFRPDPDLLWPLHQPRDLLFLGILYPLLEEVIFRGGVQGYLLRREAGARRYAGITLANLVTSLIFTGLHFIAHPPLAAAAVFLPSLIFGYFRDRHGDLRAPIALHMYYNIGYFWLFSSGS